MAGPGRGKRGGVRVIYYFHDASLPLFLLNVFTKNDKGGLTASERNEMRALLPRLVPMRKTKVETGSRETVGSRVISSLREAVDWVEGKDVPVRVTIVPVPTVDIRATRRRLGLSQTAFAAKFGFQPATLRNWEQGRTRPDGPARVLLAVIARHPEAVEDALRAEA